MKKYPATFFLVIASVILQVLFTAWPALMNFFAFDPTRGILGIPALFTHMVSHGNWPHLIGNFTFGLPAMLFLESKLGKKRFFEFYTICGIAAALTEFLLAGPVTMIGSSGAIAGIFAGACVAFGDDASEHVLALAVFLCFFVQQLAIAPMGALFGVAFYAHIGGALAGALLSHKLYAHSQPSTK